MAPGNERSVIYQEELASEEKDSSHLETSFSVTQDASWQMEKESRCFWCITLLIHISNLERY
jgi:hypothetical protein